MELPLNQIPLRGRQGSRTLRPRWTTQVAAVPLRQWLTFHSRPRGPNPLTFAPSFGTTGPTRQGGWIRTNGLLVPNQARCPGCATPCGGGTGFRSQLDEIMSLIGSPDRPATVDPEGVEPSSTCLSDRRVHRFTKGLYGGRFHPPSIRYQLVN